jgi:hypothetical protein
MLTDVSEESHCRLSHCLHNNKQVRVHKIASIIINYTAVY